MLYLAICSLLPWHAGASQNASYGSMLLPRARYNTVHSCCKQLLRGQHATAAQRAGRRSSLHQALCADLTIVNQPSGVDVKTCERCRTTYPLRYFSKSKSQPDGRWVQCRGCMHEQRLAKKAARELSEGEHLPTDHPMVCKHCGKLLPARFFRLQRRLPAGRQQPCHACAADDNRWRGAAATPVVPQRKRCYACGEQRPAADFSTRTGSSDGLYSKCKACTAAYKAARSGPLVQLPVTRKRCNQCHEIKPATAFYGDRTSVDGLWHTCRTCSIARLRKYARAKKSTAADEA